MSLKSLKTGVTAGVILLALITVTAGTWINNDFKQLTAFLSEKEISLQQAGQKIKDALHREKEAAELFEFLTDTQNTFNAGKTMIRDFSTASQSSIDFTPYSYPTEKRIELVDTLVNYQKKYTKENLETIYAKIGQKDGVSQHQESIETFLNFAVKIRDRKNEPQGLVTLRAIKADAQVETSIAAAQKKIASLLKPS